MSLSVEMSISSTPNKLRAWEAQLLNSFLFKTDKANKALNGFNLSTLRNTS